jgi:ATP-dependent Clp protease ATP-binding subunit ClpC
MVALTLDTTATIYVVFERFTDDAKSAVVAAGEEARTFGDDHVGTEHLLLGILGEPDAIGAAVLAAAGMSLETTRADVERVVGRTDEQPSGELPFTPEAKKALETALREALKLGASKIGTEHLLLGIAAGDRGVAAQLLESAGLSSARAHQAVLALSSSVAPRAWRGGARVRQQLARGQNTTPAVAAFYLRARERAGGGAVSSTDILRALLDDNDNRAARALAALGVTPDKLDHAIAEIPVEGTTDETLEDALARMVEVTVRDDRVVIAITDAALAARLGAGVEDVPVRLARALDILRQRLWEVVREAEHGGGASMGE